MFSEFSSTPVTSVAPARAQAQRKCALICKAIQDAPVASVMRDNSVIVLLIEIQTGLMSAQKIDFELHAFEFDRDLAMEFRAERRCVIPIPPPCEPARRFVRQ